MLFTGQLESHSEVQRKKKCLSWKIYRSPMLLTLRLYNSQSLILLLNKTCLIFFSGWFFLSQDLFPKHIRNVLQLRRSLRALNYRSLHAIYYVEIAFLNLHGYLISIRLRVTYEVCICGSESHHFCIFIGYYNKCRINLVIIWCNIFCCNNKIL